MNGKRLTNESFLARYEIMADENKQLHKQNADMRAALEAIKPTFYGMLVEEFGNPNEWPEDRQGVVVFDKLLQVLEEE